MQACMAMCLRPCTFVWIIAMFMFWESRIRGLTVQLWVGVAKVSVEQGVLVLQYTIGDGLLSIIRSSGVSTVQGFLMY